ncbi:putative trans-sialidase, Group VIII [Trypanosoma cruzi]|uniref:Trans-sialidase, putative n=3 Tax=Trypanosoma cruzi TaxID=5693 RepID=Q4CPF9_TRYCC|nr:trans-sialidase, putative [Trypanosoma cruzi]EAN82160.1 trans-sialidase, putative [Trypanosoma cruzi]PWU90389.1 putative trans-sialidase, Group VIII [Trypanosoma cruzi]|eukprot:XP_804011.1 trans-sialidase [Trypanosoma cruzi strain CL Brener]
MLSRVAAVMAPRTHNRRRVTGSGGKRKGGREREQQRPNVSRHLFHSAVLILLVVLCGSGAAHTVQTKTDVDPFTGIGWTSPQWEGSTEGNEKFFSLRVPSLVEVNSAVFVVAEAQCREDDEGCSRAGIASRHLDLTDDNPKEILTTNTSLLMPFPKGAATGTAKAKESMRPTTVVAGDSVYMLLRNQSFTTSEGKSATARDWGLLLVKGSVSGGNEITWNETHAVTFGNDEYAAKFSTQLDSGGGSGIKTRDGTLMFPMQATDEDGKTSLLSMRFDKSEKKWRLSHQTVGDGCRDPTIVEWGEDRLLIMASCEQGYRDVYGSTVSGVDWYTYGETLTRVWGNSHDRTGYGVQNAFIKVTIEDKDVLLVTLPVYSKDNRGSNKEKGRLHLWLTDNARVYDVGPISREADDAAASSLLMRSGNEKLISVYENKKSDGSYSLVAVSLGKQLERIKSMVKKWKDLDSALHSCRSVSSGTVDLPTKGMCNGPVPTDGLVGFLSGNISENTWRDEYLCVNATVKNGERMVPNGLTFKGSEAGAVWPVGDMGQTVPYYFANNEFTLVATVSIHEVPQSGSSPIPLMGVRMNDTSSTVLFGLSYTHEKKWKFTLPNGAYEDDEYDEYYEVNNNWQPNTTHQVMLQMDASEWDVYVDGMRVYSGEYNWYLFEEHRVSCIYFGAENKEHSESSHVTVSNVLLYNRTISTDEIALLSASKVPIPSPGEESRSVPETTTNSAAQAPSPEAKKASQDEEEETTQEVEEAPRPQSSVEASGGSYAAAVSSGGRGSHGTREEETETDGSSGSASPPASSSVSTASHRGSDGMGVREGTSLREEVPPHLGTEVIPKADVERPIHEEEATSPEGATEWQTQEITAPLVENEDSEDVSTASGNTSTLPGETKIPSKSNATAPSDAGILLENGHFEELAGMALFAESTVHGCVSRMLLLMLLGLWGTAALC